jgi:uncharacterized protein (DUF427 family)
MLVNHLGGVVMKMRAIWNGQVIAESDKTVVVEGNHYFPPDSIVSEFLQPSDQKSTCFWKGTATYFDINIEGELNPAAAWYYSEPNKSAEKIKDHIAFWRGVKTVNSDEV